MNNLDYPIPVLELVTALKQLPGIGTRGAERMALWMLQGHMGEAEAIARTIGQAAEHVTPCPVWMMWSRKTSTFNPWWNASPGSLIAKSFWQQALTWKGRQRPPTSTICSKKWIAGYPALPRGCLPAPASATRTR